MLLMAEYDWFQNFKSLQGSTKPYSLGNTNDRLQGYQECKEQWKQRCVEIFLRHFPRVIMNSLKLQFNRALQRGLIYKGC